MKQQAFDVVLAVGVAEVRYSARLARTWVFVALGSAVVLIAYGFYFAAHGYWSAPAPEMGYFSPRFNASPLNLHLLWIFLAGTAFLALDVGTRNHRERVAEVVDSRPVSNLAILAGSLVGLLFVAWVPLLLLVLVVQLFGWLSRSVGFWFGEPVEPVAQAAFLLLDGVPILCFWIALVFLLAVVFRNRLLVVLIAGALLGLQMWAYTAVPASLYPAVSLLSSQVGWASDIVPRFADTATVVHRGGLILVATALVCAAAVAHRRHDGLPKRGRSVAAAGLGVCGLLAVSWVATERAGELNTRERWQAEHENAIAASPALPDIERVSGDVLILPGEQLRVDVELRFAGFVGSDSLLLSFNPGMRVDRVGMGGQAVAFRHQDGLLEVELADSSTSEHGVTISLTASGIPDSRFAYLGSAEWLRRPPANQLRLLGTESAVFDRRFVALMPGTAWLPNAGANLEKVGSSPDFFTVDLTVAVPRDWMVAGPGRGEPMGGDSRFARVRFRPESPIAEVGLVAGRFERFAATVADVEVELLLHRDHLRNAAFFADARDALVARIDELFSKADSLGIPYPLGTLSAVEVPSRLRGYRGGWRMDTAMVLPGVLMLKEHGFPTASFEGPLNDDVATGYEDPGENKVLTLWVHTSNDVVSGADLHRGLAHNLFRAVTRASGPGADALDFVCHELAYRLLTGDNTPVANQFSAHRFDVDAYFGAALGRAAQGLAAGHFGPLRLFYPYVDRPSTWSLAAATSLADLGHHEDPRLAEDALLLRGTSVARAIYDGLGSDGAGQLLAELRRRYSGGTFDADQFALVAASVGADLDEFLGDWLGDSRLPGFLVAPRALVHRLADDDTTGTQRYQARVHVRNDEPVAGLVRLSTDRWGFVTRSWPFRIPAAASVEVGVVLPDPPNQLWLHPFSSLNRGSIRIDLADFDPTEIVGGEAFEGVRPSDWRPRRAGLVIDDLDAGFAVIDDDGGVRLRGFGSSLDEWEIDLDQGLPVMERQRGEWIRLQVPSAWGKYRHTAALVRPGRGNRELAFVASLDRPGRWQLEYHIPNRHVPPPPGAPETYASTLFGALGRMDMRLESGGENIPVAFDAGAAEVGWNKVGEYELDDPSVRFLVSNRTDGEAVVADAIRWLRVDGSPAR